MLEESLFSYREAFRGVAPGTQSSYKWLPRPSGVRSHWLTESLPLFLACPPPPTRESLRWVLTILQQLVLTSPSLCRVECVTGAPADIRFQLKKHVVLTHLLLRITCLPVASVPGVLCANLLKTFKNKFLLVKVEWT